MKRLALAAALATFVALPASAQYGPRYGYDRPPPYDDDDGPPRYRYDRRPERYGGPPQYRRGSRVCVTSRGNCPTGGTVPRNSPCGCDIPGFGYKRGQAG